MFIVQSSEESEDRCNNHATLSHHPEKEEHREKNNTRIERSEILLKTKHMIKWEKQFY